MNKQTTSLQEFIERLFMLKQQMPFENNSDLTTCIKIAESLLHKERSQLEKAHEDGIEYAVNQSEKNGFFKMSRGDEYYETTFQIS